MRREERAWVEAVVGLYGVSVVEEEEEEGEGCLVVRKVGGSTIPKITILDAVELKKRGLLIFKEVQVQEETAKPEPHRPKIAKGFARPIPVPLKEE
ncbi:hypothetical protein HDU98_011106, partial [Podochytrium sp. JEL0797]